MLILSACTSANTSSSSNSSSPSSGTAAPSDSAKKLEGTVKFGVISALTGTNKMVGDQITNGANMAAEYVNANGGILGKKLELVFEDEIDNQQASVNAMTKLMQYPDVVAFYGSTASGNCIAAAPTVLDKKMPMIAGGSSANIPKQNNPYIWQTRMTDDQTGKVMAKVATQTLKMKNPAILYSTESFGTGMKDQTMAALKQLGIEVQEKNLYGYTVDEKNYAPLIEQIRNSGCDGLIAIAQQKPAVLIVSQIDAAGLEMPLLGSASFACDVVFQNCKEAANGWYCVGEWVPTINTELGKKLVADYKQRFNANTDAPTAYTYDSILLFAEACRIANTTTDKEAINKAFEKIKDFKGAMSTYTYAENHSFATTLLITHTENIKPVVLDSIKAR